MIAVGRAALGVALFLLATLALPACSGDDDGDSDGDSSSPTPFIAPPALSTEEALALLDEIDVLVRATSPGLITAAGLAEAEVEERTARIRSGEDDASGLDDVRAALETGDRVGAGEYLFNVVRDYAQQPFNSSDTGEIDEETLDQIDPHASFDEDHEDGMIVSGVYKAAILEMMELWYGLLGEPEDTPAAS